MTTTLPETESRSQPVVVLVDARSDVERELIADWAQREHPGAPLVDRDDPALGARLGATTTRSSCPSA